MKLSLKKTTLAVVALGLSGAAFAASYTPEPAPACVPGNVTVPCERSAWDIGFDLMWVQPTSDQLRYARTGVVSGDNSVKTLYTISTDYDFGFRLEGSYHWGTGSDVNLNWVHFDQSNENSVTDLDNGVDFPVIEGLFETGKGRVKHQLDVVNLEWGQHVDMGQHVNMRFHAGGQYARLDTTKTLRAFDGAVDGYESRDHKILDQESTFDGIGPRAGFDSAYNFGNGFSVIGRAAAALLVGDLKTNQQETDVEFERPGVRDVEIEQVNREKERVIAYSANADLAVAYTHPMAQGDLTVEGGWRWQGLYNVVRYSPFSGAGAGHFGVHGPYIGLKWVGNVA